MICLKGLDEKEALTAFDFMSGEKDAFRTWD